jgi:hypothetical protein
MNDTDVRDLLMRIVDEVPATPVDPEPLLHRGYRRMARTAVAGTLGIAFAIAVAVGGVGLIRSSAPTTTPAGEGQPTVTGETTGTYNGPCADSQDGPPQQVCLGPLDEGTYTSQRFEPALTFTVPAGWNNVWDTRGAFGLWAPGWSDNGADQGTDCRSGPSPCGYLFDQPGLSVRRDPRPIWLERDNIGEGCMPRADATVGTSALEVATWVANHPAIATEAPSRVEVAGLTGYLLDVSLADTWREGCPEPRAVWLFEDLYLRDQNRYPEFATARLILLDLPDGGSVLIWIDGTQVDTAMPVVDSFVFDVG